MARLKLWMDRIQATGYSSKGTNLSQLCALSLVPRPDNCWRREKIAVITAHSWTLQATFHPGTLKLAANRYAMMEDALYHPLHSTQRNKALPTRQTHQAQTPFPYSHFYITTVLKSTDFLQYALARRFPYVQYGVPVAQWSRALLSKAGGCGFDPKYYRNTLPKTAVIPARFGLPWMWQLNQCPLLLPKLA